MPSRTHYRSQPEHLTDSADFWLGSEGDGITRVDEGLGGFVVFGAFEAVRANPGYPYAICNAGGTKDLSLSPWTLRLWIV
ncbi:hypothetical protein SDJN02_04893, partial [Cucurbita argyrosperma subsp. argyrosperma]